MKERRFIVYELAKPELTFTLRFPNGLVYVPIARSAIEACLASMTLGIRKGSEFIFAVGEALSNAAEHGFRENGYVTVRIHRITEPRALVVEIEDDGPGFNAELFSEPDEARGFGIRIMNAMADQVEFSPDGRRVRLWKLQARRKTKALWTSAGKARPYDDKGNVVKFHQRFT